MTSVNALALAPLPLLPQTQHALLNLLGKRNARNSDLQRVILQDPGAAVAVFRHLHRLRPDAAAEITDIAHALSLIGFSGLQHLLVELPTLTPSRELQDDAVHVVYSHACHAAAYARTLGQQRGLPNPAGLATAALLQHPAALALCSLDPEAALRAAAAVQDGVDPAVAYGAELRADLDATDRQLAERWGLPGLAVQVLHAAASDAARLVALSTQYAWLAGHEPSPVGELAGLLQLGADRTRALLHQLGVTAARELHPLGYPVAAYRFVQIPAEPALDAEEQARLDAVLTRRERRAPAAAAAAPPTPLHQALTDTMHRLQTEVGLELVVFAMLSRDRRRIQSRLAVGGTADDPLRQLHLGVTEAPLFHKLLAKPQSVWIHPANAPRYTPHLPTGWAPALQGSQLFAMSLIVGARPVGVMYGIGAGLTESAYQQFRNHCQEAMRLLARDRQAA